MDVFEIIAIIIFGIPLLLGIIGVIIYRIKTGAWWTGQGFGKKLIETLEKDEYFLRAQRIEIPASLTAVDFYRKMGYDYKNGNAEPEDGLMYRLEKYR